MPETPTSRSRGQRAPGSAVSRQKSPRPGVQRSSSVNSLEKNERPRSKQRHRNVKTKPDVGELSEAEDNKESDSSDPEEKLCTCLEALLTECSRQRLRALRMSLRHYSNVDNRVSFKDIQTSLQENQVRLSQRALTMISEIFEDGQGIDYEKLYACLTKAHLRTGRDSIKARNKRNDLNAKQALTLEQIDQDFLRRLEELLVKDQAYFDVPLLRNEFSKWDQHRVGQMAKEGAQLICSERTSLYGALLTNLINRCDENKDGKISWPLLLNFLEKAQAKAWEKHPELATLPEKVKEAAALRIATPGPIDELSSSTRSKVMTKLLKKTSFRRNSSTDNNTPERQKPKEDPAGDTLPETGVKVDNPAPDVKRANPLAKDKNTRTKDPDGKQTSEMKSEPRGQDKKESIPEGKDDVLDSKVSRIPSHEVKAVVPNEYKSAQVTSDPPSERLQLEWIYGYRGHDTKFNLCLLASGEIIYFIGTAIILYNHLDHVQRHYREHTECVRCISVHPAGMLVASGQYASRDEKGHQAHFRLWRSDTLQTLHVLGAGLMVKCVMALCFMPGEKITHLKCGRLTSASIKTKWRPDDPTVTNQSEWQTSERQKTFLASIKRRFTSNCCDELKIEIDILACADNSQEKKLTLWDVKEGSLVAETFISTELLCDMGFNPKYPELLVTCGKEHLSWWKVYVEARRVQPSAQPNYEGFLKARYINCLSHNQKGDVITGDSNGTIYIWGNGGNSITNFVKHGHDGSVLSVLQYRGHLLTAGRDGAFHCWSWRKNMDKEGTLQLPKSEGGARCLLLLPSDDGATSTLVLGTTMNSLIYVNLNQSAPPLEGVTLDDVPITQGHTGDLRAVQKIEQSFLGADIITASTDGVICKLNSETREPVWKLCMKGYPFLCVDINKEGDLLVLGTKDGHLVILQVMRTDISVLEIYNKKISTGAITTAKLSQDQKKIATGGTDKTVHIYSLQSVEGKDEEVWALSGKCQGHHGNIHAIDWSSNTLQGDLIIRSSSSIPEQKFWNVNTCTEVPGEFMTDVTWATTNCVLDHTLIGLWKSKQASEGHMTCVDVSPARHLAAMATSDGSLSLFRYPSCSEGAFSHTYKAHHHTHNLCFTPNGRSVLTVGGSDDCIMQWKLV
ncbi:echinoderm microtubule-associated protein-like 2 isoform X3 [Biomphalaria pfeifferi]|uniref:Echinoderm microtubule-associated protein-like 2 isoform X3 n=1 Tax=Biomphalaria pfeifferi TaxID=112525 RepID=A0AAD8C8U0_BIOPF|nr:echinoderm microtubule-associated protein-like 2 isoform X3 [Biomphalaria pfeifferi]